MEKYHDIIMNNTTMNVLNRRDKKKILEYCKGKYSVIKLRLKNTKSKTNKLSWVAHHRYVKAGGDVELFKNMSLKFAGNKWLIGERLNQDFPNEGKEVLRKFLKSSFGISQDGLSDLTLYLGTNVVSDEFLIDYYKSNYILNSN